MSRTLIPASGRLLSALATLDMREIDRHDVVAFGFITENMVRREDNLNDIWL